MSNHIRWRSNVQTIVLLLLLIPHPASPIGLGNIIIESFINQPLNAKIQLVAVRSSDIKGIRVGLASKLDFDWIGIKRTATLEQLKFIPTANDSGGAFIRVSTGRPVGEPNLNFLVELRWPNGRLLREYSIELKSQPKLPVPVMDPVVSDIDNQSQIPTDGSSKIQTIKHVDKTVTQPPKPGVDAEPQSSSRQAGQTAEPLRIYTPVRGDTLFEIAKKFLPDTDTTVDQMMLAILRSNPQGFVQNNINGLKSGIDLRIPSAFEVSRLTPKEARATVRQQYAEWRNRSSQPEANAVPSQQPTKVATGSSAELASKAVTLNASDERSRDNIKPAVQLEERIEIAAQTKVDTIDSKSDEQAADIDNKTAPDKAGVEEGNASTSDEADNAEEVAAKEATAEEAISEEQLPTDSRLEILSADERSDEPSPYSVDIQEYIASLEKSASLAQELAESRREEVVDIKQRMQRLESVISQQERLITLQNNQLSDTNQRLKKLDEDREQMAQAMQRSESNFWKWLLIGFSVPLLPLLIVIYSLFRLKRPRAVQQFQPTEA